MAASRCPRSSRQLFPFGHQPNPSPVPPTLLCLPGGKDMTRHEQQLVVLLTSANILPSSSPDQVWQVEPSAPWPRR